MAGLLDDLLWQTLSGGSAGQPAQAGGGLLAGPTGLLGSWKPPANEGFMTRLLGSDDPRDPRGAQMAAFAAGLLRRDPAMAFEGANRARYNHEAQQSRRLADSMTLTKSAYELQQMQDAMRRNRAIQEERARGYGGGSQTPPTATGSDAFGVPTVGDMPMFSMGSQPQTRTLGAPGGAPAGVPGARPGSPSQQERIYRQLLSEAALYQKYGDTKTALEFYQRAEQFKPKFSTTPQLMRDPRTNQLVQVTLNEEGGYQILPFGAKPDVSLQDLGGRVVAIDRNTAPDGASWQKTMTPGETASNALGWANNRVSRDRLAFEQGKPELRDVNGQLVAVYPNAQGGPSVRPVNGPGGVPLGGDPKLTEVQGNATQFISRMRDASRTLEEVTKGGAPWPSTVERAGYKPEFPSWLPGGQIVSAGIAAANKAMTPEAALQVRQAQDNWITANLRKESGAAIPVPELEAERAKWFPMPGEGEAVAKQKAAARRVAEEAMLVQAGPGGRMVPQVLERADAAGAKQGGGEKRAAKPAPLPSTNAKDLKHGTAYELPNGTVGRWDSLKRRFEVVQ